MPDAIISDSLEIIAHALALIARRFESVKEPDDFIRSEQGLLLLDAISMRLQVVGEKIKKIEQHSPGFWLERGIDPQPIIRFRDYISHHYEGMEHEVIYDVCKNHLPDLEVKVGALLA